MNNVCGLKIVIHRSNRGFKVDATMAYCTKSIGLSRLVSQQAIRRISVINCGRCFSNSNTSSLQFRTNENRSNLTKVFVIYIKRLVCNLWFYLLLKTVTDIPLCISGHILALKKTYEVHK